MADGSVSVRRSVTADMAERFGMEVAAFEQTLRATVVPSNITKEQFAAFLLVAKQYRLNPLTKEIFAFPAKGGGIVPVVSIDGWLRIVNDHEQMNGLQFEDIREDGKLVAVTARVFRKDRDHAVEVTEYMDECRRDTDTWKKWPARMLRHKATIQAARYAFGFSGIYDQDEAERMPAGAGIGAPVKKSSAQAKRDGDHEKMIAQIDACETMVELESWWATNETLVDALPNEHWQIAVRDRYEVRGEAIADQEWQALQSSRGGDSSGPGGSLD